MGTVSQRRVRRGSREGTTQADRLGVGLFGLLITAAPLAFGGVDRLVQISLLALFGVALALRPPRMLRLDRWTGAGILALAGLLLGKEFAPAAWFGSTHWRTVLEQGYGVALPWSHHPEPGRAGDALLAGGVAVLWFLWVRTLAFSRENRAGLAWTFAGASALVAAVSFATQGLDPQAIYGWRFTPGWTGFGPFPNRNHTAAFLAMGALMGCGCVSWAVWRKKPRLVCLGLVFVGLSLAAMLASQSRGGLIVLGAGLVFFAGLVLARLRDRRAFGLALAACLSLAALSLAFGAQVLSRFASEHGHHSAAQRVEIWKDTVAMWKDAPVLGHGAGSFASVYPLYQTVVVDDLVVLHPESSWLQWLAEFGLLPVGSVLLMGAVGLFPRLRPAFDQRSGFFLFAGSLAAAAALLAHSAIDVPSHRWATAAFGLAALGLAFPARTGGTNAPRLVALVPFGIACFWLLPLLRDWPGWSPLTVDRLIARSATSGQVSEADLKESLRWFPLNAKLHQLLGAQQLMLHGAASPDWAQHFNIAARLRPTSAALPALQAQICGQFAPQHAVSYWQKAIERAGERRFEFFNRGLQDTASLGEGASAWAAYADAHPELLLTYAAHLPEAQGRQAFDAWWSERASGADLPAGELEMFYRQAARWLPDEKFEGWMQQHPEREAVDYQKWAALLHGWGREADAWKLLQRYHPEPPFPGGEPKFTRAQLEKTWTLAPENVVNAQALAQVLLAEGDLAGSRQVILVSARRDGAPVWFRHRAAHALAAQGQFGEAVALLLGAPVQ